ncbi:CheR family methyltransferase [Leptolyngbya sp. FACHB-261]|uniref:CheR family methyltransferase n=1 Tax=Leptolyngbya sp. FACHB-261 TaxID=2692806 RepID=UPI0016884C0B|nr:CheR family methyltransferase [Leptolyngbya sp. FACHB-261]MBD2100061.1 PAS domain-containing protein [Leptolyngbya sp. FACHB-261]
MSKAEAEQGLDSLLEYIKRGRGFDFTGYKRSSLVRRVNRRMQELGMEAYEDYLDRLEVYPDEFTQLFNTILINVTALFRDAEAWSYLAQEVIPQILANKSGGQQIRAWSAGCASGEEAYTLAIVLAEALGIDAFRNQVKIYATDLDEEALAEARQATYSAKALQVLPEELTRKYFEFVGGRYAFRNDLRRCVIFGRHDLIQDAPISHLDLLICRNVLMYFNSETQSRVLSRFHFALNDDCFLFLGKAEMLLAHANLFTPLNLKHRVFLKSSKLNLRDRLLVLAQSGDETVGSTLARQIRMREASFDAMPLAQVVVNAAGTLVLVNEQARHLFDLKQRDVGRPFHDLALSYQPIELRSRIDEAMRSGKVIDLRNIEHNTSAEELQFLDVQVAPLLDADGESLGASISFTDVTRYNRLRLELQRSNQELETASEELQSTNEELETTNEELQSTVEELETTNEELQSTNEEMETMNEELQSTNEELQAINEELRERTEELNDTNAFLESILTGLRTGIVVLNRDTSISIWNHQAEELWGLRSDEVEGQLFLDLDIGLPVERLQATIENALSGEAEYQELFLDAINRRGRSIRCRITCTPLVNSKQRQGAILLMEEWKQEQL